jgi:hypothetical protein
MGEQNTGGAGAEDSRSATLGDVDHIAFDVANNLKKS